MYTLDIIIIIIGLIATIMTLYLSITQYKVKEVSNARLIAVIITSILIMISFCYVYYQNPLLP